MYFLYRREFDWSDRREYDFVIPGKNCIIETNGAQHYGSRCFEYMGGKTYEEEKVNDQYKKRISNEEWYTNYIYIDSSQTNEDFVINNILNNEMFLDLFDLSSIDMRTCKIKALPSKVKKAIEMWNNFYSIKQIAEEIQIVIETVPKYLERGNSLELCSYSKQEGRRRGAGKIINVDDLNVFWSAEEASLFYGISYRQSACNTKNFMKFNRYIEENSVVDSMHFLSEHVVDVKLPFDYDNLQYAQISKDLKSVKIWNSYDEINKYYSISRSCEIRQACEGIRREWKFSYWRAVIPQITLSVDKQYTYKDIKEFLIPAIVKLDGVIID